MRASQQTARLLSAANTTNATLVSGVPGLVFGLRGTNGATASYLKLYDKATAPDQNDVPRQTFHLPANAAFAFDFANPAAFGRGIGYRITLNAADNDNTAVAAGAVLGMNLEYS